MLADAEEVPGSDSNAKGAHEDIATEPPAEPPVRRKAKTKIGNKTKKKKKTKTTSKFPDGEARVQVVEFGNLQLMRSLLYLFCFYKYIYIYVYILFFFLLSRTHLYVVAQLFLDNFYF